MTRIIVILLTIGVFGSCGILKDHLYTNRYYTNNKTCILTAKKSSGERISLLRLHKAVASFKPTDSSNAVCWGDLTSTPSFRNLQLCKITVDTPQKKIDLPKNLDHSDPTNHPVVTGLLIASIISLVIYLTAGVISLPNDLLFLLPIIGIGLGAITFLNEKTLRFKTNKLKASVAYHLIDFANVLLIGLIYASVLAIILTILFVVVGMFLFL